MPLVGRAGYPDRGSRPRGGSAENTGAVFALAAKRTVLAAVPAALVVAVSIAGAAGGASSDRRDHESPSAPANVRVVAVTQTLVHLAWDTSVDDVGVVGYYIFSDNGQGLTDSDRSDRTRVTVDIPEYTFRGLSCGQSLVITLVAFDDARNRSEKTSATVSTSPCADTQPPLPPSGFTQVATTEDAVVLAWTPSADDVGVVQYGVYRNLQRVATPAEPKVALSALSCGSTYEYAVDAVDAAGNRSPLATVYARTASCPTPPPSDPTPPTSWTFCANEYQRCSFSGTRDVRYGADGTFTAPRTLTGGFMCTNGVFGDPLPGATKRCETRAASSTSPPPPPPPPPSDPTPPTSWTFCANEYQRCSYSGTRDVRYGADGTFTAPRTLTGGFMCTNGVFGDPLPGATKRCETRAASSTSPPPPPPPPPSDPTPPTSWTFCANEYQRCSYSGTRDVRYGADGTFTAPRTLTGGFMCTNGVFGDPLPGATKRCETRAASSTSPSPTSPPPPQPPSDTTPPSAPSGLRISSATRTSVSLTWIPASDNVAVAGYETYVNDSWAYATQQAGGTVTGLSCGTAYTFGVDAFDTSGNHSTRASVIGSTAPCADTQAPSAPANLAPTSRTATSIALGWAASTDNAGVTGYGLYRSGTLVGTSSTTTGIFAGLACNTNYTLAVDAYDAGGNRSTKSTVMVSTTACADTTPPSAPTALAASNATQTSLALTWNAATDNLGVTGYDVYRNATKVATVTSAASSQIGLTCGTAYTFGVVARDAAGNSSSQATLQASTSACSTQQTAWTFCANEYQQCAFSGTKDVRYGADGTFTAPRTLSGGVMCTNGVFGDPLPGANKHCEIRAASSTASLPPPPSTAWTGPITITQGGTYSGSWSASGSTPAVTIATSAPVTIVNSRIRNLDGGDLIQGVNWQVRDLTLERTFLYGGTGRVFDVEGFNRIIVRNCTIENTSGMKLAREVNGATVLVTRNKFRNIQGPAGYLSAFFKVAEVQNAAIEVSWNEVVNEYDQSHPEDVISLFKSAHAKVHDNYIQHSSTPGNAYNTSSQGTITMDYPDGVGPVPHHNEIVNNQMVDTVNGVHIPDAAHDNLIRGNRLIQDGKLPDGQQMGNGWGGYSMMPSAWNLNNRWEGNVSGYVNRDGDRLDWAHMPAAVVAAQTTLPGLITAQMEQAEWTLWQQKLAANGVTVGA